MIPKFPEIGLVSHPALTFTTDAVDITISISCPGVKVLKARLYLLRASADSGKLEIHRATWVLKCDTYFMVRVKFPMSHCRYDLVFSTSSPSEPDVLVEHPIRYHITTSEACQNLLISLDHPLGSRFGFGFQSPFVQAHGITVIAPVLYRMRAGFVHFLVHVDAEAYSQLDLSDGPEPYGTSLFSHRLAPLEKPSEEEVQEREERAERQRLLASRTQASLGKHGSFCLTGGSTQGLSHPVDAINELHEILQPNIGPLVQDIRHSVHIDISVLAVYQGSTAGSAPTICQRYVKRLHRRSDLPELYDRLLWFPESDADHCVVEMLLRFPRTQAHQYAPLKIGEWKLTRSEEDFPAGF